MCAASSLPFGFWSVWDVIIMKGKHSTRRQSSLPFGFWSVWDFDSRAKTAQTVLGLHCLSAFGLFGTRGQTEHGVVAARLSSLPFGFWSVWDVGMNRGEAFYEKMSSLPFGFWSVWDESINASCAGTYRVFIAFRLLVCLGRRIDGGGR